MRKIFLTLLLFSISFTLSYGQNFYNMQKLEGQEIVGQWDFDDTTSLGKATVGSDIELFGTPEVVAGPKEGNSALLLENGDYLKAVTAITPGGTGTKVNTYTIVMDIKLDQLDGYASLLQTDLRNSNDGSLFLTANKSVGNGDIGYSVSVITEGKWYRMVLVSEEHSADNVSFDIYLDGTLAYEGIPQSVDKRLSLNDSLFFFLDNDGEEKPTDVAKLVIYNYALSSEEIANLGNVLDEPKQDPLPDGKELISNSNFDDDLSNWNLYVSEVCDAVLSLDTTSQLVGENSAHVRINTLSSGEKRDYHIQFYQNLSTSTGIKSGHKYYVQYKVKSNKAVDDFYMKIHMAHDPWYALDPMEDYVGRSLEANEAITVKESYIFTASDSVVKMCFDVGLLSDAGVDLWIDDIHLIEDEKEYEIIDENLPGGSELLTNNYFDSGLKDWSLYKKYTADATLNLDTNGVIQTAYSAHIHLDTAYVDGSDKIKFKQTLASVSVKKDRKYHIQFMAKSNKAISGISIAMRSLADELYNKEFSLPENEVVTVIDSFYSSSDEILLQWSINLGTASKADVDLWFDAIHLIELPIEYTNLFPPESTWDQKNPETLSRPAYLESVHDNVYGVDYTCISDPEAFNVPSGSGALLNHYPKDQAWNADMSKIVLGGNYLVNADDYTFDKRINVGMSDSRWSNVDPKIRYFCSGDKFKKVNIETEEVTELHTFPGYNVTVGPYEGNISADDKYVVITNESGGIAIGASLYDIELDSVISTKTLSGDIDWVSVPPSGDYIVVNNRGAGKIEVYDLNFNFLRNVGYGSQHGDFGVDSEGNEVWIQVIPVSMYRLSDGEATRLLAQSTGGHISGRGFNNPGWALVTLDINPGSYATEIFEVKLDGSGIIRNFGHTRSSCTTYDNYPMGSVSPDGKKVIFNSDWLYGTGSGGDAVAFISEYREITDIEEEGQAPKGKMSFELSQNYPNPFNPTTRINFNLRVGGMTKLVVYNILGQKVKVLLNENLRAGFYSVPFDGTHLTSGTYFYKLQANNQILVKKMLLVK